MGRSLMLYAPIDTFSAGDDEHDVPWVGKQLRPDMVPADTRDGDYAIGLGASNPKGHAAAILLAGAAIAAADIRLTGDLVLGFGAGGMPTNHRPGQENPRMNTGQGVGCSFMLEQGIWADQAIICKPGWAVHWEEVGLCWFEVRVQGTYSYVGSRHRIAYQNSIVSAATVITEIEAWFAQYTAAHTNGQVSPQGNIGSIEAGWPHLLSAAPALCRFRIDLRTNPRSSVMDVKREFESAIIGIRRRHPEISVDSELILAIPGSVTDPANPVVQSCIAAWENVEGRPHEPIVGNSGATDANILRSRGIPTARVGMDRIDEKAPVRVDFPSGMNVVDLRSVVRLARYLVAVAVDICGVEN